MHMQARYKKAADWDLVTRVASDNAMPVIGNGDVLTHYEAVRRLNGGNGGSSKGSDGVHAVMVGRGALTKPWIFWVSSGAIL